jgi:hypothetical protein
VVVVHGVCLSGKDAADAARCMHSYAARTGYKQVGARGAHGRREAL